MDHLTKLENQSIFILREVFSSVKNIAMLWSLGKDYNVMVWLAFKAFYGKIPFPLVHVDTEKKFKEIQGWKSTSDGREAYCILFKFADFKQAFSFMTSVALKATTGLIVLVRELITGFSPSSLFT